MREKEYNDLLKNVSVGLGGLNQVIYELLVLLVLYIFINRIYSSISSNPGFLSRNSKSVIILFSIFAVVLDWFIWFNPIQTLLFTAVLVIYIRYNLTNLQIISTFIDLTGQTSRGVDAAPILPSDESSRTSWEPAAIASMDLVSLPYDTKNIRPFGILAYDKTDALRVPINDAYKPGKPYVTITDSAYAKVMLDELYQTPQYQNSHVPDEIDSSLANDIHYPDSAKQETNDAALLNSFRNPTRQFLDSHWLTGDGTYNDICKLPNCRVKSNGANRDAICNVVPFGKPLEQCTNQENTVSINQLDKISNNEIPHMEI